MGLATIREWAQEWPHESSISLQVALNRAGGAHVMYSTKSMRNDGGYEAIQNAIAKFGMRLEECVAAYGEGS
ncbi:hypothetical protein LIER_26146 [Lithospermum erythrorhizon]|uniref:Uncharacterized protein n=1 Tax=Lithospermum erythrorhizon TaxID=34254 RepID=A0AAV3R7C6_LITER